MCCLSCLVFICVHCLFLKLMKSYKDMFCRNKSYLCQILFLIEWRHRRLKNTIDPLLFYGEHFCGFSEVKDSAIANCINYFSRHAGWKVVIILLHGTEAADDVNIWACSYHVMYPWYHMLMVKKSAKVLKGHTSQPFDCIDISHDYSTQISELEFGFSEVHLVETPLSISNHYFW